MPKSPAAPARPADLQRLMNEELREGVRPAVHALANTLEALRLRFEVLRSDPACVATQRENLDAIARILGEAMSARTALDHAFSRSLTATRPRAPAGKSARPARR
jgi:hypothetical protein